MQVVLDRRRESTRGAIRAIGTFPFIAHMPCARVENVEPLRVSDVYFFGAAAGDRPIDVMETVELVDELASGGFEDVEVGFVPECCGG